MPQAKFSQYYKKAMKKMLDYLDKEQCLAIRIDDIKGEIVTFTIGVSDGRDFILEFGTVSVRNKDFMQVKSENIYVDMHKMIHMEYNLMPTKDISPLMLDECFDS